MCALVLNKRSASNALTPGTWLKLEILRVLALGLQAANLGDLVFGQDPCPASDAKLGRDGVRDRLAVTRQEQDLVIDTVASFYKGK